MILTHYHHKDQPPFQNLSVLSESEALKVMSELGKRTGEVYHRFRNPQKYLRLRQATERWLKQEFIRKGGQPLFDYPAYFVVERATWIEAGCKGESSAIQIPLSAFKAEQVSFTYPDSMVSYSLRKQQDKAFYHPEYHAQVFDTAEIRKIIDNFGMPAEAWRTDETRKHDLFIEAQVWGNIPEPYNL